MTKSKSVTGKSTPKTATSSSSAMKPLAMKPPAPGQMVPLADDLYWMRFTLPFRLNHINLYAFDTVDGWLVLDCGIGSPAIADEWENMLAGPLAGAPVCGIIVSHYHADHVGYAGSLARITGAPIYMGAIEHEQTRWNLNLSNAEFGAIIGDAYARFNLDSAVVERVRAHGNYFRQLSGDLPEQVTIIDETHSFKTKSGVWNLRFDTGHSPGQMSLFDQQRKLHICVDFLLPRISPNISVSLRDINSDMLGHYLTYLGSMQTLDDSWVIIPGHDWPYYGAKARATELIEHHAARLQILQQAAKNGPMTTAEAMQKLFNFELTDHELYFASCEARAHLNHLVHRQILTISDTIKDGVDHFSLA